MSEPRGAVSPEANVSVERFERRRRVREQFVDRLLASSTERALHCPMCDERLNKNDELALLNAERFHCRHCGHDLAEHAYRQVAYDESRWLPLVPLIRAVEQNPGCADCAYLGAVATACRQALQCMGRPYPSECQLLDRLLSRTAWRLPDCEWASCVAVKEYRQLAAEGIALL